MTTRELFSQMQQRLDKNADKLAGVNTVYQFEVTGSDPGTYNVVIVNGHGTVHEGPHANPRATVSVTSEDLQALANRQLDPMLALMRGRLRVQGDLREAMRLATLLR